MKMISVPAVFIVAVFCSCAVIRADSVVLGKRSAPLDMLYVASVACHGGTGDGGAVLLADSLVFALAKRGFRAASFSDAHEKAEGFRHHAVLSVFQEDTGDFLEKRGALTLHLRVYDARSGDAVAMVRLHCDGCDVREGGCAALAAERIAAEIDAAARR